MGKQNKRKQQRRRGDRYDPVAGANADVRQAERTLFEARRRAATLAARNGHSPAEQAEAFFNRPGDYYIATFNVGGKVNDTQGVTYMAECVLKADEEQLPYLVEVLRQIRGGFGEQARISLSRAQTQQQRVVDHEPPSRYVPQPGMDDLRGVTAVHAAAREAVRRRTQLQSEMCKAHRDPDCKRCDDTVDDLWAHPRNLEAEDMTPDYPPGQPDRTLEDLTREQLQAQLPGMTRAQIADELGVDPADIGGEFKHADTIELETLAAELGVKPDDLQPIDMAGGGRVYAVKPRPAPSAGRHTRAGSDVDT